MQQRGRRVSPSTPIGTYIEIDRKGSCRKKIWSPKKQALGGMIGGA